MKRITMKFYSTTVAALAASCVFVSLCCPAQTQNQLSPAQRGSITKFLRGHLKEASGREDLTTRYSVVAVDLRDDGGEEFVVYVSGRDWCGSGGCRMFVLAPKEESYKIIADTTITQLPIRVLTSKSNGWHDLAVWVQGGGIQPGYEAELRFDGHTYPSNPSILPARRLKRKVAGKVLVPSSAVGKLLY